MKEVKNRGELTFFDTFRSWLNAFLEDIFQEIMHSWAQYKENWAKENVLC